MGSPIFSYSTGSLFSAACLVSLFLLCSSKKGYALDGGETLRSHHHTLQVSSLLPPSVCSTSAKDHSKRVSLKVVHRHGPCSPLINLNKARAQSATQILSQDQSRVNSIQSRVGFKSGKNNLRDSRTTLTAKRGSSLGTASYIVTVGLGTPKKNLSLIFDTGSDLTWTQCQPCLGSCYKQQEPTFDPSMSKTYKNITCKSVKCSQLTSATGNTPLCYGRTCIYGILYGDQSFSIGFFGSETLTLTPTDVFPNFLFGCGEQNQGLFGGAAGLLGLGRNKLSTVSQTASKYGKYFSYCLPSMSSSSGHLTFGKGASSSALKFTPFSKNSQDSSFYFIDIMAIKVGGMKLPISPSVFESAGTVIDSGTVITRLPPTAYTTLRTAFRHRMTKYTMAQPLSILDTCYDLSSYSTVSIPTISFYFGGNIEVPIDPSGILYSVSVSQVCLAFAGNSNASNVGIFGNVQQQTLDVVYDVARGKLGFGMGGCS